MVRVLLRGAPVALVVALAAGCAARGATSASAPPSPTIPASGVAIETPSLSEAIRKIRHLSATAKPKSDQEAVMSLESSESAFASDVCPSRAGLLLGRGAGRTRRIPWLRCVFGCTWQRR